MYRKRLKLLYGGNGNQYQTLRSNQEGYDGDDEIENKIETKPKNSFELIKNSHSFNANMLNAAYKAKNKVVTVANKTYVAGTDSMKDVYDDITKIPNWNYKNLASDTAATFTGAFATGFLTEVTGNPQLSTLAGGYVADKTKDLTKGIGDVKTSTRYNQLAKEINTHPQVNDILGHSLGGSVALEYQRNNPKFNSTTYGAPVFEPFSKNSNASRFRQSGELVSALDSGAKTLNTDTMNPMANHGYDGFDGFASNTVTDDLQILIE